MESRSDRAFGLDAEALAPWLERTGPVAIVDFETTGFASDPSAEPLEFGAVLLEPGRAEAVTLHTLLRPSQPIPAPIERLTRLSDAMVEGAPRPGEVAQAIRAALASRSLVAHNAGFERHFLARFVAAELAHARYLDTQDLLALTHPDAPDLRLETFTRALLGTEERHRAVADALDAARVLTRVAVGALRGELRYRAARAALGVYAPESPWLALLGSAPAARSEARASPFVPLGTTTEPPVPFHEDAIATVLADEKRGRRHVPGYRARKAQLRLAREVVRALADGGVLLLEGGAGVGKSLAYLAAAIPFAMERWQSGRREPVLISTRTKLLQDQLLAKDIPAAARLLGYPELRALSIKGRANYACARRLARVVAEGTEPRLFAEDRMAYAVLAACTETRAHGEIGSLPGGWLRRYPALPDLVRRAVSARVEQCTREQCASHPNCPFGRRRAALAQAHLVVANHDLALRWPPDYPSFSSAILDEVHELGEVADEVYALELRPEQVLERLDEIFGRPESGRGSLDAPLPAFRRRAVQRDALAWRRGVHQDLAALGRALSDLAGEFGDVEIPERPDARFAEAARHGSQAAARIDELAAFLEGFGEEPPGSSLVSRATGELRSAATTLRLALEGAGGEDAVASFEGVEPPFDRWRLLVRPVSPAQAFEERFLSHLRVLVGVSASLFVDRDAFAALGEVELESRASDRLVRVSEPSPFPYAEHMRVVALDHDRSGVEATADVLEHLARRLGGRTLGLFTSLRRMHEVAALVTPSLRRGGLDVLVPRRASDDPTALVERFCAGPAVLLGARKFWQGLDIPGAELQAVVIEKLPFEVPSELRRRREARLRREGIDAFERYTLGRMLLNLKQMVGRLIRTEEDRGLVVIVEARPERPYFARLDQALPPGCGIVLARLDELDGLLADVGLPVG